MIKFSHSAMDKFMDPRFLAHNTHLKNPKDFEKLDFQLAYLKTKKFIFCSSLLDAFPTEIPGIYSLGGGRQIGKTTLLKQWMANLLKNHINPKAIAFLSGELIEDFHSLLHLLQWQINSMPQDQIKYLILDEVTYIKDWDKAIKFAADSGLLTSTILMITGSDLSFIKEARMRFPGRRGQASIVDFHLYPLSFKEFISLKRCIHKLEDKIEARSFTESDIDIIFSEFNNYLIHGGYLTAINDIAIEGKILDATLTTYSDWIRGDVLKKGKHENYLREILGAIINRYGSQVTWNTLAANLSIDHPQTVADYIALLDSMDAVFIQAALIEHKLVGSPKKARKVAFTDPFIYHAINAWLNPKSDFYENLVHQIPHDPVFSSRLVEACVASHYHRHFPTYYIKADGEVDIAYVKGQRFWPIEVKWTNQLKPNEIKQIAKYPNGLLFTKGRDFGTVEGIPTIPIPIALLLLTESSQVRPG